MTIALIIPVYNEAPFLRRCLDSVKNQTVPFNEVIVIDDGSLDGSAQICDEYEQEGFRIIHTLNEGVSRARNRGILMAESEYVTFLDSDDELLLTASETMRKAIKHNPDADIIQFNHWRYYEKFNRRAMKYMNPAGTYSLKDGHDKLPKCWCMVWNKVYCVKYGAILFNENLNYGEDELYNLTRLLNGDDIRHVNDATMVHHFENNQSICHTKNLESLLKQDFELRKLLHAIENVETEWFKIKAIVDLIDEHHKSNTYKQFGWEEK